MVVSKEHPPFTVVAYDPGGTTGYAIGRWMDGLLVIESGQDKFSCYGLFEHLRKYRPEFIVCESFEYRNRSRAGLVLTSVELIGIVKLYEDMVVEDYDWKPPKVFFQNAAKGKSYYDNNKLKNAHLYKVNNGHGHDAVRHLLQWYTFEFGYQFNTKGFEPA